jgi:hypothetical protein
MDNQASKSMQNPQFSLKFSLAISYANILAIYSKLSNYNSSSGTLQYHQPCIASIILRWLEIILPKINKTILDIIYEDCWLFKDIIWDIDRRFHWILIHKYIPSSIRPWLHSCRSRWPALLKTNRIRQAEVSPDYPNQSWWGSTGH